MYTYYFEKLEVWKLSITLSKKIYSTSTTFPKSEHYSLTSQLRRAIISVPTNIAEGISWDSFKDQVRFSTISYGSLMESLNLIIIAHQFEYIDDKTYISLRKDIDEISNKLNSLKKSQIRRIKR